MPTMMDSELFPNVAADVAMQAMKDGVARKQRTWQEVYDIAKHDIDETHAIVEKFEHEGVIQEFPEDKIREIVREVCEQL